MTTNQHNQTEKPSIGIAGGGLLGRTLAWRLLLAGYKVSLFEAGKFDTSTPSGARAAAFTAAGMVAPLSEAVVSDVNVYHMGLYALAKWPEWLKDLPADESSYFSQKGSLVVAHPQDYSELDQFEQELKFVIPECSSYHRVSQRQINELEPDLHPSLQRGLYLADEAHINNRELLNRLALSIRELKANIYAETSVQVSPHLISKGDQHWEFDWVIDCRGLGAKPQLIEPNSRLRGVRGETLHIETREVQLNRPVRLMHPRYQLYVVPKPGNKFIIGATQIESEDKSPISLQSTLELSSALYTLSPAFAEARIIETDSNLRPAFMDNLPKVKISAGLISANGLFRHGYLLAPAVVENIIHHLEKTESTIFDEHLN